MMTGKMARRSNVASLKFPTPCPSMTVRLNVSHLYAVCRRASPCYTEANRVRLPFLERVPMLHCDASAMPSSILYTVVTRRTYETRICRVIDRPEDVFLLSASFFSLLVCAATFYLRNHLQLQNDRIRYGVEHLPAALFAIAVFIALVGLARPMFSRISGLANRPSPYFLTILTIVFGLCWLPVWLAGGFVQDDWLLLAAASIRKIIYIHPAYSWYALDSVDGNFRPLGTILYFGYMLKWFGLEARAFTFGSFLLTLLGSLAAFAIVRELGYSKVAAAAASLLFMTRGMLYTVVALPVTATTIAAFSASVVRDGDESVPKIEPACPAS